MQAPPSQELEPPANPGRFRREDKAEAYIAREHARVKPEIEALKPKLKSLKGYIATGSAYSHGLIGVLREIGVEVDGSLVFHHDPVYDLEDSRQDSLGHLIEHYGDVEHVTVGNRQQFQFYNLLQRVKPDFIIIRHNGLAPLAARLGIPAIPLGDEHHAVGYQGMINLGESILAVLQHRKFHQDISRRVTLPYKASWLAEADPFALARAATV